MWLMNGRAKSRQQKKWEALAISARAFPPSQKNKTASSERFPKNMLADSQSPSEGYKKLSAGKARSNTSLQD